MPPLDIVADVDATGLFTVTTKFSEPMDQAVIPSITFDPSVATTLTNRSGGWTNETTFVLTADIDDAGVDANAVTVDVSAPKILQATHKMTTQRWSNSRLIPKSGIMTVVIDVGTAIKLTGRCKFIHRKVDRC